jgi:two-component system CheB/CheR fusion protein
MLDLDGFKAVNDRHGHRVGDLVLAAMAERLLQAVRRSDVVARLHGDEFVIATGDHLTTEAVAGVAERVLDALRSPVAVEGHRLEIRASVGVAIYPLDATAAGDLLARADAALYAAKAKGGDVWERRAPDAGAALPSAEV